MRLEDAKKTFDHLLHEMNRVIVGMDEVLKQMIVALLTNSHAILEGYPGLAKTLSIKTMAQL
ncbi:MAG: ATPase, partial [Candidatus Woesearchaeota archaeon]